MERCVCVRVCVCVTNIKRHMETQRPHGTRIELIFNHICRSASQCGCWRPSYHFMLELFLEGDEDG